MWVPDREGEGDGKRGRERNEWYSIHYLVKDILRKTVSELPFFLRKKSLFIGKIKKKKKEKYIGIQAKDQYGRIVMLLQGR